MLKSAAKPGEHLYSLGASDRILSNILGPIQGVLNADDDVLIEMQETEHLFEPSGRHSISQLLEYNMFFYVHMNR